MKIKITDIDWIADTDDVDETFDGLPSEIVVDIDDFNPDFSQLLSDWLSNTYDYCFNGFCYAPHTDDSGDADGKGEKVYILTETYGDDVERADGCVVYTKTNRSVHRTMQSAIDAMKTRHDEIVDEIIGEDDNELSRISVDDYKCNEKGNTVSMTIMDENCNQWELNIEEMNNEK